MTMLADTNVFLRFLTKDDPVKYERCHKLFQNLVNGKIKLCVSEIVIFEITWTLLSYYNLPKEEVITKITSILNTKNLEIYNKNILTETIALYARKNIDFIDAYNAIVAKDKELEAIVSYDEDFDKVEFIKRIEP